MHHSTSHVFYHWTKPDRSRLWSAATVVVFTVCMITVSAESWSITYSRDLAADTKELVRHPSPTRMFQGLINIEGTIVSSDGEILPGVTIIIQGTTNGVVTNNEGHFKMRAPGDGSCSPFLRVKCCRIPPSVWKTRMWAGSCG